MADDVPYLLRGVTANSTESSVLISSSPYLNDWRLREWVAMAMLRKNAPNNPFSADSHSLNVILEDIQDFDEIDALFEAERANNPVLDRWLGERFLHSLGKEDFADYPPESLGGVYYRYLVDNGFDLDIREPWVPTGHFSYLRRRAVQVHDWDHILCGGSFDAYGELIPYYVRLTNMFKYLPPELAKHACTTAIFGSGRIMTRTMLHYPQCWGTAVDAMQRGIAVGQASDCMFTADYEAALGMELEEARRFMGVREVRHVDTAAASRIFMEEAG